MPRLPTSGKVDRAAVAELARAAGPVTHAAPAGGSIGPLERWVLGVWASIGVHASCGEEHPIPDPLAFIYRKTPTP